MQSDLDRALRAFVSWGISPYPVESPANLRAEMGAAGAADALVRVAAVISDLDSIRPDWTRHDLDQAARHAAREVANMHGDIGPDGIAALIWTYSWWYK